MHCPAIQLTVSVRQNPGSVLPGTASCRVIQVFRGSFRLLCHSSPPASASKNFSCSSVFMTSRMMTFFSSWGSFRWWMVSHSAIPALASSRLVTPARNSSAFRQISETMDFGSMAEIMNHKMPKKPRTVLGAKLPVGDRRGVLKLMGSFNGRYVLEAGRIKVSF